MINTLIYNAKDYTHYVQRPIRANVIQSRTRFNTNSKRLKYLLRNFFFFVFEQVEHLSNNNNYRTIHFWKMQRVQICCMRITRRRFFRIGLNSCSAVQAAASTANWSVYLILRGVKKCQKSEERAYIYCLLFFGLRIGFVLVLRCPLLFG